MEERSSAVPVAVGDVAGARFLEFADVHSRDPNDGTRIHSQFSKELAAGDARARAAGVHGCGQLLAAASSGVFPLPRAGAVSARLDVVVTAPHCRGKGLAQVVVAEFVADAIRTHGDHLEHMSVIAAHPAIGHIVQRLGFTDAGMGASSPVYHRNVDGKVRPNLLQEAERMQNDRLTTLRGACARCLWRRQSPWCRP
jgi:GNAT superfamily N-acetyltransferase